MSRQKQSYNNRGFMKVLAYMGSFVSSAYNYMFHNKNRNNGKAGGHLDTSYQSNGTSFGDTKKDQHTKSYQHKATIEKKRRRKEVDKSKRINRKRATGVCSFK
jgi:hypothetical protein